jgi:hypothetical protein
MTGLVVRRALLDYARRPLNLVLLVAVPVVIVVALSGELANMSKLALLLNMWVDPGPEALDDDRPGRASPRR